MEAGIQRGGCPVIRGIIKRLITGRGFVFIPPVESTAFSAIAVRFKAWSMVD
jgi:hypothetical protein